MRPIFLVGLLLTLLAAAYSDELDSRRRPVVAVGSAFLPDKFRVGETDLERAPRSPRLGGGDMPSLALAGTRNFDDSGFLGESDALVFEDRFGEMDRLTVEDPEERRDDGIRSHFNDSGLLGECGGARFFEDRFGESEPVRLGPEDDADP